MHTQPYMKPSFSQQTFDSQKDQNKFNQMDSTTNIGGKTFEQPAPQRLTTYQKYLQQNSGGTSSSSFSYNQKSSNVSLGSAADRAGTSSPNFKKLFIHNIDFRVSNQDLFNLFSEYGKIYCLEVPRNAMQQHRGLGFVEYDKHEDARRALEGASGRYLHQRELRLDIFREKHEMDKKKQFVRSRSRSPITHQRIVNGQGNSNSNFQSNFHGGYQKEGNNAFFNKRPRTDFGKTYYINRDQQLKSGAEQINKIHDRNQSQNETEKRNPDHLQKPEQKENKQSQQEQNPPQQPKQKTYQQPIANQNSQQKRQDEENEQDTDVDANSPLPEEEQSRGRKQKKDKEDGEIMNDSEIQQTFSKSDQSPQKSSCKVVDDKLMNQNQPQTDDSFAEPAQDESKGSVQKPYEQIPNNNIGEFSSSKSRSLKSMSELSAIIDTNNSSKVLRDNSDIYRRQFEVIQKHNQMSERERELELQNYEREMNQPRDNFAEDNFDKIQSLTRSRKSLYAEDYDSKQYHSRDYKHDQSRRRSESDAKFTSKHHDQKEKRFNEENSDSEPRKDRFSRDQINFRDEIRLQKRSRERDFSNEFDVIQKRRASPNERFREMRKNARELYGSKNDSDFKRQSLTPNKALVLREYERIPMRNTYNGVSDKVIEHRIYEISREARLDQFPDKDWSFYKKEHMRNRPKPNPNRTSYLDLWNEKELGIPLGEKVNIENHFIRDYEVAPKQTKKISQTRRFQEDDQYDRDESRPSNQAGVQHYKGYGQGYHQSRNFPGAPFQANLRDELNQPPRDKAIKYENLQTRDHFRDKPRFKDYSDRDYDKYTQSHLRRDFQYDKRHIKQTYADDDIDRDIHKRYNQFDIIPQLYYSQRSKFDINLQSEKFFKRQ
eukprot:403339418